MHLHANTITSQARIKSELLVQYPAHLQDNKIYQIKFK